MNDEISDLEPALGGDLREEADEVKREIVRLEAEHGCRVWRNAAGELLPITQIGKDYLRNIQAHLLRRLQTLIRYDQLLRQWCEWTGSLPPDGMLDEGTLETVAWFRAVNAELLRRRGKVFSEDIVVMRAFGQELLRLADKLEEIG